MDTKAGATILGTIAATSSSVGFAHQIARIGKTEGKYVSYFMPALYVGGVALWLWYEIAIGATALSRANAASLVFAGTCLTLTFIKARQTSVHRQRQKLRIAIDMDETIADSLKEQIRRYNSGFGEGITAEDLCGKHIEDVVPAERADTVRRMLRNESFFDCLDVIPDAQEVLHELAREHELFIVSAAMEIPESFAAKYRWLRRHFPFIPSSNIVFCGNKGIIDADYLVDDEARHFHTFRGTGILFSAPHNLDETACERVFSWQEIRRKFLEPARTGFSTKTRASFLAALVNVGNEITTAVDKGDRNMRMNTYVNFHGNCADAFRYYEKHLGGKVSMMMTHGQSPDQARVGPEWKNAVLHARIVIGDQELMAADIPNAEPMRSAYLTLRIDSDAEAEQNFSALSDGGKILMPIQETFFASRFGQVQDRFGINWMVLHERPLSSQT